jgi:hypothetical protein
MRIINRDPVKGAIIFGAVVSVSLILLLGISVKSFAAAAKEPGAIETKQIAEGAYIYGFPMIMNYGTMYEYSIDRSSSQYKAPFNRIYNTASVYTPADTAVVTPNSDTPYSFVSMDLRAEPIVLCMPEVEKGRYYSVQLVDMYTYNIGYIGSRATGNGAGCYMVSGPNWKGEAPAGIAKVFPVETDFGFAIYRTQLFNPGDINNIKKIQAGYKVYTLSEFMKKPAPPAPPVIDFPKFTKKRAFETDPFGYLNFLLQFCPPIPQEKPLRDIFARIGIEPGKPFEPDKLSMKDRAEIELGIREGYEHIKQKRHTLGKDVNGWRITSAFGNRQLYKGNWTLRAAAAMAGIYGNDAVEAMYPIAFNDGTGSKLDASKSDYSITFPAGELPPVNAFWSVTMYNGKTQLLVANPINRYLINSPMLPGLVKNPDGSLTIYVQKNSPGKDKESNWLPAPDGPFYLVMRLYWPKKEALDGKWSPPPVILVKK